MCAEHDKLAVRREGGWNLIHRIGGKSLRGSAVDRNDEYIIVSEFV